MIAYNPSIHRIATRPVQTIVEPPESIKRSSNLLKAEDKASVINCLAVHPKSGDLLQGTGGIRKLRWSTQSKGKSGGVRVIYYYYDGTMPLFLFTYLARVKRPISVKLSVTIWPNSNAFYLNIMVVQMASAYSSIKQGLTEAIDFSEGKVKKAAVHESSSIDVKHVSAKAGMSQSEFASAFCISVSTLRHWERGDCTLQGPALVLLNVVAKETELVLRALES